MGGRGSGCRGQAVGPGWQGEARSSRGVRNKAGSRRVLMSGAGKAGRAVVGVLRAFRGKSAETAGMGDIQGPLVGSGHSDLD